MLFWKVSWSTVLVLTFSSDSLVNAAVSAAYAFFGVASAPLEPNVTVFGSAAGGPPPHAARAGPARATAPAPISPLTTLRRLGPPVAGMRLCCVIASPGWCRTR